MNALKLLSVVLLLLLLGQVRVSAANELTFKAPYLIATPTATQETVNLQYEFTNTSAQTVKITKLKPNCDCTTIGLRDSKIEYTPGETGIIYATMKLGNFTGIIKKTISVTCSGAGYLLTVEARIPELIKLTPRTLTWKQGEAATTKTFLIHITMGDQIRLTEVDLTGSDFDYKPIVVKEGREYKIEVTPKSTAKKALNTIWIRTNSDQPRYKKTVGALTIQ